MMKKSFQIDWSEIDAFGHINSLVILKYVQSMRVEYCTKTKLLVQGNAHAPILINISCQYLAPLYFPGEVTVQADLKRIGETSVMTEYLLFNDKGETVARAEDVIVYYDYEGKKKIPIPDDVRKALEKLFS